MREENKIRLMVVPIAAMLVVTMFTAADHQQVGEREIEVEEGYDELTVVVPPAPEDGENQESKHFENESTATTLINEDYGSLELGVSPRYWHGPPDAYMCFIEIDVKGDLSLELDPKDMVIQTESIEAPELDRLHVGHRASQWDAEGLELWPGTKRRDGVVGEQETIIGSYLEDEDNFSVDTEILIEHPTADLTQEPITIEFRATLRGLSEKVTATSRVTFEKGV